MKKDLFFGNLEVGDKFRTKETDEYEPFEKIGPVTEFGLYQAGKSCIESRKINAKCGSHFYSFPEDALVMRA